MRTSISPVPSYESCDLENPSCPTSFKPACSLPKGHIGDFHVCILQDPTKEPIVWYLPPEPKTTPTNYIVVSPESEYWEHSPKGFALREDAEKNLQEENFTDKPLYLCKVIAVKQSTISRQEP